jgi:hypothetical protein
MEKPSRFNERLTLIANIAVVVGIVFLALELRQNTSMMQAQIRDSMTEKQMEYLGWVANSPALATAEFTLWSSGAAALDGTQLAQYARFIAAQLREWENSYYQGERGLFTAEEFEARKPVWRGQLARDGIGDLFRDRWDNVRGGFAPDFRAEVDAIVAEIEN